MALHQAGQVGGVLRLRLLPRRTGIVRVGRLGAGKVAGGDVYREERLLGKLRGLHPLSYQLLLRLTVAEGLVVAQRLASVLSRQQRAGEPAAAQPAAATAAPALLLIVLQPVVGLCSLVTD